LYLEITDIWLSVQKIAEYLGISIKSIYRWVEPDKIPAHKIKKYWKFQFSEVNTWISGEASKLSI